MTRPSYEQNAMPQRQAEYWGLRSICRRMGWKCSRTPVRRALNHGFPLYLKVRIGHTRQLYYSNEKLIIAWEWSRCEREIVRLTRNGPIVHYSSMRLPQIEDTFPDRPLQ